MKNKNYLKGTSLLRSLVLAVLFAISGLWTMDVKGQTIIIDGATSGGFEAGVDFTANGWTVANNATSSQWVCDVGATAGFTGTRCAYITNNTAAIPPPHTYTNTASRVSQLYRDVTVPSGETSITLTFNWINVGESGFDRLQVWAVPTSFVPPNLTTGITATGSAPTGRVALGTGTTGYVGSATWTLATITVPAAYAGTTFRLVFQWRNDASGGSNPPIGVDNINMVSTCSSPVTALNVTAVTTNSATLNWTAGGATAFNVRYKKVSEPTSVATWTTPTATTLTSLPISGLTDNTAYEFQVAATAGASCLNYTGSATFTTLCNPSSLPWTEGFEGLATVGATIFPGCWNYQTITGNNPGTYGTTDTYREPRTGTKLAYTQYSGTAWIFTPNFVLTAGTQYQFSFYMRNKVVTSPVDFVMDVAYGTAQNAAAMTNNLQSGYTASNSAYQLFTYTFTPPSNGNYNFGIKSTSTSLTPWYLSFDDFSMQLAPTCAAPSGYSATNVLLTTADVSWTAVAGAVNYFWELRTSGTCGAGSPLQSGNTGGATSVSLSGLSPSTLYTLCVYTDCGAATSTYSSTTFTTGSAGENCATAIDLGTLTSPYSSTTTGAADDFTNTCAFGNTSPDLVFYINVPAGAVLSIGQTVNGYDSENTLNYGGSCPGTTQIACFDDPDIQNITWTNTTGIAQTVWWVQDGYSGSTNNGTFTLAWSVGTCATPTGLGATNITSNSANLTWACSGCPGSFELEWGASGFTQGSGTLIDPATNPQSISGLSPSTAYQFYVRQDCGLGDFSSWTGPFTFTTTGLPPANDLCTSAIDILCGDALAGTTVDATVDAGLPAGCSASSGICGGYATPSVWYHFVGTGQLVTVTTCSPTGLGDTKLAVFSGSCGSLSCEGANDDDAACTGFTLKSTVQFQSASGTDYYILVHGCTSSGTFTISLTCTGACTPATTNDNCGTAAPLTSGVTLNTSNGCAAGATGPNPTCLLFQTPYDVWYSFNSGLSTSAVISLAATTATSVAYAVYTGSCGSLTQVYCNTTPPSINTLTLPGSATPYYIQVWTSLANRGDFDLTVTLTGGACMAADADYTQPVCAGQTLHLTSNVTFGTGPYTYQWSGAGTFSSTTAQNPDVTGAATGNYTVTITDQGNLPCSITETVTVTINPLPDPVASSNAPVCEGFSLTLFGDNSDISQTNTGWSWSGPSFSSASQNPTISNATTANSGTYTLTVTNSNGCTASTTHNVTVNTNPVLSIASQTNVSCNGLSDGSVDLDATSGTSPFLFDLIGPSTADGIFTGLAAGPYTATVSDDNGCTAASLPVTITEPDVLTVSAGSNTPVCTGTSLNLTSSPVGGTSAYSYAWTGPNGPVPAVQNPTIASATTADAGQYDVLITDANGCTSTASHTVLVNAAPTAAIALSGSPNKCLGQSATMQLTFTGTGPWNYTITGNGGPYSGTTSNNPENVNVTPIAAGVHNYTVTSVGNTGCPAGGTTSGSATVNVSTAPPPVSGPIPSGAAEACAGTVMLITSNVINGQNIIYSWNTGSNSSAAMFSTNIGGPFSPGPFQTSTNQVYVQFGALGGGQSGYHICLQGVNGCGSSINKCLWLRGVVSGPGAITPANAVVACPNDVKSYSCGASGGASLYSWTLSGSSTPITSGQGTTNVQVTFPPAFTSGQLCVTAALACGGSSTSPARCMTINKNPANPNVPTGAATVCPGQTGVSYSIAAVPGATGYNWTVPANATIASGANSPSITVNFPTPYNGSSTVCVTTTSACGASAVKCKNVVSGIPAQPAGITGPLTNVCGSTVQYSVVNPAASSYSWTNPAGTTISGSATGSTILLNVSSTFTSGTLTVVANSVACAPATSAPRTSGTIWGRPNNPGAITANPTVWCSGGGVNFSITPAAPLPTYTWTVSNGTIDAGQGSNNIDVTWGASTAGTVSVRAGNGCGLSAGINSQSFSSGCREEGINASTDFSVYPNPAHDKVTVSIYVKESTQFNIKLRDLSGRVILSEDRQAEEGLNAYNMDLKGFAKGIYMLEVQSVNEKWKAKVIIE